jgi:hypothetical protein
MRAERGRKRERRTGRNRNPHLGPSPKDSAEQETGKRKSDGAREDTIEARETGLCRTVGNDDAYLS